MPQLDVSTYSSQLFWLVICFFSMYFIMAKLIIPRIADIMEQRQNKIDDYISRADEVKRQAEESLEKYRSALSKELCRLQEEGLLQFHKNHFTLFGLQ